MIRKESELRSDAVTNLMGGDGDINRMHFLEVEDFAGHGRLFAKFSLEPGSSIGFHKHEGEQEAYYILSGKALYNDNGKDVTLEKGHFALCKSGEGHSIESIGEENLEFIALIMKA
ncbi:MAG: cupin domain-containing protein [Tissierellaceae bacterium]|nr:cupin domain-containing protein [Tissierellaceae bacterium]